MSHILDDAALELWLCGIDVVTDVFPIYFSPGRVRDVSTAQNDAFAAVLLSDLEHIPANVLHSNTEPV